MVVPLFSVVSLSDYDNAFSASTSLGWLCRWFYTGFSDRLALIYFSFVSVIALCNPLRGSSHLFVPFLTYCNYFYVVLVCFGVYYWRTHPFFILGLLTFSSVGLKVRMIHLCNPFLNSLKKKKKKPM